MTNQKLKTHRVNRVTGTFRVQCIACGKRTETGREPIYADLDGKPWFDYYCEECARDNGANVPDTRVFRYVVTCPDRSGTAKRTLWDARQGRYTYATEEEAQAKIDAVLANNPISELTQGLEVRQVECWPVHFDPKTCWFDR